MNHVRNEQSAVTRSRGRTYLKRVAMKGPSDGAASEVRPEWGEGARPLKCVNTLSFSDLQWAPHAGCCGYENMASAQPVPVVIGPRDTLLSSLWVLAGIEKLCPAQGESASCPVAACSPSSDHPIQSPRGFCRHRWCEFRLKFEKGLKAIKLSFVTLEDKIHSFPILQIQIFMF